MPDHIECVSPLVYTAARIWLALFGLLALLLAVPSLYLLTYRTSDVSTDYRLYLITLQVCVSLIKNLSKSMVSQVLCLVSSAVYTVGFAPLPHLPWLALYSDGLLSELGVDAGALVVSQRVSLLLFNLHFTRVESYSDYQGCVRVDDYERSFGSRCESFSSHNSFFRKKNC